MPFMPGNVFYYDKSERSSWMREVPCFPPTESDILEAMQDLNANELARGLGYLNLVDESIPPGERLQGLLFMREERRALRAGWSKLPLELKDHIIAQALVAEGGVIRLHCLTAGATRANIGLSLLRVNRNFYDIGIRALYQENKVVFAHYGSDLKLFHQAIRHTSRLTFGIMSSGGPVFGRVKFELGDCDKSLAFAKIAAFTNALRSLPPGFITIRSLTIELLPYAFETDDELHCLTEALSTIVITSSFTLQGFAYPHLEFPVRQFAVELQTDQQPKRAGLCPPKQSNDYHGWFTNEYDVIYPRQPHLARMIIIDASAFFIQWKVESGLVE